jgi:hypothetical protein
MPEPAETDRSPQFQHFGALMSGNGEMLLQKFMEQKARSFLMNGGSNLLPSI